MEVTLSSMIDPLKMLAHDVQSCGGDALSINWVLQTGKAPQVEDAKLIKSVSTLPIFIGSGFNNDNAKEFLPYIDGLIVGSALKVDSILENPTDIDRVKTLMDIVRKNRK